MIRLYCMGLRKDKEGKVRLSVCIAVSCVLSAAAAISAG